MTVAPRVINVPLAATTVAPTLLRVEPFAPGQSVLALSAGAGQIFGAASPAGDVARQLKFIVKGADVAAAAATVAQTAAARVGTTKVTGDLTINLGIVGGRLPFFGAIPANATNTAAEMLGAIVKVDGVVWGRGTDANAPNPGVKTWVMDADTEAGYILQLGADATDYIPVGAEVEILLPNLAITGVANNLLAKPGPAAGAALAAGVAEERLLSVVATRTDTAGRSGARDLRVDFAICDVAAVSLTGLSK
jgi:hypothetical protein